MDKDNAMCILPDIGQENNTAQQKVKDNADFDSSKQWTGKQQLNQKR